MKTKKTNPVIVMPEWIVVKFVVKSVTEFVTKFSVKAVMEIAT